MLTIKILRIFFSPRISCFFGILIAAWITPGAAIAEVIGNAVVYQDGSLKVGRHIIHLYGIYLPPTDTKCTGFRKRCPRRAALALRNRIQGFVRCVEQEVNPDGTLSAICQAGYTSVSEGHDLAAYLLQQGWAVALPEAPPEYHLLEKIAYRKGFGIWGGESFHW
jgi:endonuclease YncB( thermonuclease family)